MLLTIYAPRGILTIAVYSTLLVAAADSHEKTPLLNEVASTSDEFGAYTDDELDERIRVYLENSLELIIAMEQTVQKIGCIEDTLAKKSKRSRHHPNQQPKKHD